MNPKPPKYKRATASVDIRNLPPDVRWIAAQSAVNSVLSKFGIKTKITFRENGQFLVVEGERRRSPKPVSRVSKHPMYRQVLPVEKIKKGDFYEVVTGGVVTALTPENDWIGKTQNDLKVGGKFYRGV